MREVTMDVNGYAVKVQIPDETQSITVEIPIKPEERRVTVTVPARGNQAG